MKRATTITLLAMGVGGAFAASTLHGSCEPTNATSAADLSQTAAAPQQSCSRSGSHGWGHSWGGSSHAGSSSGVSRGGFGGFGHSGS
jgi:hypothetical protein